MSTVFRSRRTAPRHKEAKRAVSAEAQVVPSSYFRWNWIVNRLMGAVLLVFAAPVVLLSMLAVVLTSRGAPLYRQKRVGKAGRTFTIYKIRSMRIDAEAKTGPIWTTSSRDPRITPVGGFLRRTHLDELPQLINVVRGEMALVGPRPERPEFAEALADEIPGYLGRLQVLPGVTGLAQVNLPPDADLDSVRRKLVLDVRYIAQGSFLLDVRLLLATLSPLVGIPGRSANRLLRLHHNVEVSRHAETETREPERTDDRPVRLSEQHTEILNAMSLGR